MTPCSQPRVDLEGGPTIAGRSLIGHGLDGLPVVVVATGAGAARPQSRPCRPSKLRRNLGSVRPVGLVQCTNRFPPAKRERPNRLGPHQTLR
jgi:hypothetical protein